MSHLFIKLAGINGSATAQGYESWSLLHSLHLALLVMISLKGLFYKMRYLLLLSISFLLAACSSPPYPPPPPPNTGKYAPEINLRPRYFMTVRGYVDPKIKDDVQLEFITIYYTTNPACKYTINYFEGVSSYREIDHVIKVKTDQHGNYKYAIPLDLYKPGFCGWNIVDISYKTDDKIPNFRGYSIASFLKKEISSINYLGEDNWMCQKGSECQTENHAPLKGYYDLYPRGNYKFIINLKRM